MLYDYVLEGASCWMLTICKPSLQRRPANLPPPSDPASDPSPYPWLSPHLQAQLQLAKASKEAKDQSEGTKKVLGSAFAFRKKVWTVHTLVMVMQLPQQFMERFT